jgi:hypothetical protein
MGGTVARRLNYPNGKSRLNAVERFQARGLAFSLAQPGICDPLTGSLFSSSEDSRRPIEYTTVRRSLGKMNAS